MQLPGLDFDPDHPDLDWLRTKVEGVSWIPLHLEADSRSESGDASVLIRMEAGHGYPAHRHLGPEDVLVLRGGYEDELGLHVQGDHVRYPAGSSHSPIATGDPGRASDDSNPACVLYATIQLGIEILGE